ncbi:MAG: hypothetical protein HQL64_12670 [Magnetococcales bacterium]|nr:hypothetical protein [Magnetococcales bacterium]
MKRLGDLILPASLQWTDRWDWSPVAQEAGRTLGGAMVTWSQPLSGGRPVTLEAEEEVTWLSRAQVDAVIAMAMQAGAVFALEWDGETCNVMFRHHEPPATSFKSIRPHSHQFTGSIKLMQV